MRYILCVLFGICFTRSVAAQDSPGDKMFIFGTNGGIGASYTDKLILLNLQGSMTLDYFFKDTWSIQFAPRYTWLAKWNEHYLTIPVHLRKILSGKLSVYAGPALTFDIGYFKGPGISAGINFHLSNRSALNLSVYTFTLYHYHIDYMFIPVGLTYSYAFLK
jgi:hypothetical protein